MDHSDAFEDIWPKTDACPCAANNEARTRIIETVMQAATELHKKMMDDNVCPIMLPSAVGMTAVMVLAIQQKLENPKAQTHMLQFPRVGEQMETMISGARNIYKAGNEAMGTS